MSLSVQKIMNAPYERVFEVVADIERYPEWNSTVSQVVVAVATDEKVGTVFNMTCKWSNGKEDTYPQKVVFYDSPSHLHLENISHPSWVRPLKKYRVEAHPEGALYRVDIEISGLFRKAALKMYGDSLQQLLETEMTDLEEHIASNS